ncbi:MAG: hypothetical protein CSA07_02010 [Bacteroidia bacterium]|nr:MAG: hypothetical protein CSA07_02010 [Bacteroidia bacterium]
MAKVVFFFNTHFSGTARHTILLLAILVGLGLGVASAHEHEHDHEHAHEHGPAPGREHIHPPAQVAPAPRAQSGDAPPADTLSSPPRPASDSARVPPAKPRPKNGLDAPIDAKAADSICYYVKDKRIELYGGASLQQKNQRFESGYMDLDINQRQLFAAGRSDTAGKVTGKPVFHDGGDEYTMTSITYNFRTQKARISGVMTKASEGYLHGEVIKRMPNDVIYVKGGKFTTCEHPHPHYYIHLTRAKVVPNDKIFTDIAYLVIADVPTPLLIPFGFFPNNKTRSTGIILPEYGEENKRGFFVRNGGFYLGLNDYMDLTFLGSVYTKGSWDASAKWRYALRYRFTGSVTATYSAVSLGQRGTPQESQQENYRLTWQHIQDRTTHPYSTFQANVTLGSSAFNRYNSKTTEEFLNNQILSSVSYSRRFPGTPISLTTSFNHSQNTRDSIVDIRFPQLNVNVARIYPFKRSIQVGKPRWYEKIGFAYGLNLQNKVHIREDKLFTDPMYRQMQNGIAHNASVSAAFKTLKYLTISPTVSYRENWYYKTTRYHYDPDQKKAIRDTVRGFERAWQFNTGISTSTTIYGMYAFSEKGWLRAVRHVLRPTVGFSYHPDFSRAFYGAYRRVQTNEKGDTRDYSIFEGTLYGGPPKGESGTLNLALNNSLEMKVRKGKDTTRSTKKVPLLRSLSLSTAYNFLADSLRWADLRISASTNLLNVVSLNASSAFSPYDCLPNGQAIERFYYDQTGNPLRFKQLSLSAGMSIQQVIGGQKSSIKTIPQGYLPGSKPFQEALATDYMELSYEAFKAPWDVAINYNYSYSKNGQRIRTIQTASLHAGFSIGESWRFGFSTNYDINARRLSTTTLNIHRDLHCWEMSLNVVPFGILRSFTFRINVKSSILRDLKYDKSRSYVENLQRL